MATLYSTVTAAERLGVNKSTVSRHVAKLGVGQRLGPNLILTAAEVARLKKSIDAAQAGNPSSRNELGRFETLPEKKTRKRR